MNDATWYGRMMRCDRCAYLDRANTRNAWLRGIGGTVITLVILAGWIMILSALAR